LLVKWVHHGRLLEVNDSLIKSIRSLDRDRAICVLEQLKEPRECLQNIGVGRLKDYSLVVPIQLKSNDGSICVTDDNGLIDCGAGGKGRYGFMSRRFIERHGIPTDSLPYPIAIYNVDGSLNVSGAITQTCTLNMRIGDHVERLTFRITNTGS
ncbi:hypothetical protein CPB84DRAFT_1648542, partial [Gymnopilus junonius]